MHMLEAVKGDSRMHELKRDKQEQETKSNACCTLAEPTSRLGPDAVGSANVNGFPTRHRLSGGCRPIGSCNMYNATVFHRL